MNKNKEVIPVNENIQNAYLIFGGVWGIAFEKFINLFKK